MNAFIHPCQRLEGLVTAPPSKNYTARYLLGAALADGESEIVGPAENEDALAMRRCLTALGAEIRAEGTDLRVLGFGKDPRSHARLDVGNAGAVLRFLMATAALGEEIDFVTHYPESLGRRPHGDLAEALRQLGVQVESNNGRLPLTVRGGRPEGGPVKVNGNVSSQFTSALLFLAPVLPLGLCIQVQQGLRSRAAVETTIEVMAAFGLNVEADWERLMFRVSGRQQYRPGRFMVNGDYPGALAILAASTLIPGEVTVEGLLPDSQGERAALPILAALGGRLHQGQDAVTSRGGLPLRGVSCEGDRMIDAVLSLATVAAFAEGESVFNGVGQLRYKESDRLGDFAAAFGQCGLQIEPRAECLIVAGRPEGIAGGQTVDAHEDHRLVMALTAAGLRSRQGLTISGAEHVRKSYPGFFADLQTLGARIDLEE